MTREEQINKKVEELLNETKVDILDRPLLRTWYKLGVNFADKNPINRTDWQQVRIQASISAMQGIAAQTGYISADDIAKKAISYADALVKELKGE